MGGSFEAPTPCFCSPQQRLMRVSTTHLQSTSPAATQQLFTLLQRASGVIPEVSAAAPQSLDQLKTRGAAHT